jgi:hypothetical protein
LFTDSGFLYGTYKTINYLIEKGVTVYQYILSYEGEFSFSEIYGVPPNGVCHADDQLYLWNPWLLGPLSGYDITGHLLLLYHKEKLDFMLDLTLLGTKVKWQDLIFSSSTNWDNKHQSQAQSDQCKMQMAFQSARWCWEFLGTTWSNESDGNPTEGDNPWNLLFSRSKSWTNNIVSVFKICRFEKYPGKIPKKITAPKTSQKKHQHPQIAQKIAHKSPENAQEINQKRSL